MPPTCSLSLPRSMVDEESAETVEMANMRHVGRFAPQQTKEDEQTLVETGLGRTKQDDGTTTILAVWTLLYLLSGIVQPLLTDAIKYRGGTGRQDNSLPPTLLPTLANASGMASVTILSALLKRFQRVFRKNWRSSASKRLELFSSLDATAYRPLTMKVLSRATLIDFASAVLVTRGLLLVGSGVYTVIYSSTTAWTAVISYLSGTSKPSSSQWLGIAIVTLGLFANSYGVLLDANSASQAKAYQLLLGAIFVLCGTVLHGGAFVYNERVIKGEQVSPFQLCGHIGGVEAIAILLYNAVLLVIGYSPSELYLESVRQSGSGIGQVLMAYILLVLTNGLHALSFFAILGKLGAVATGILKSFLAVSIFTFAAIFFCNYQVSQCFTPFKAAAMLTVLFGSFVYVLATHQLQHAGNGSSKRAHSP